MLSSVKVWRFRTYLHYLQFPSSSQPGLMLTASCPLSISRDGWEVGEQTNNPNRIRTSCCIIAGLVEVVERRLSPCYHREVISCHLSNWKDKLPTHQTSHYPDQKTASGNVKNPFSLLEHQSPDMFLCTLNVSKKHHPLSTVNFQLSRHMELFCSTVGQH